MQKRKGLNEVRWFIKFSNLSRAIDWLVRTCMLGESTVTVVTVSKMPGNGTRKSSFGTRIYSLRHAGKNGPQDTVRLRELDCRGSASAPIFTVGAEVDMAFSDMTGEPESGSRRFSDMGGDQLAELGSHLFPEGLGI